MPTYTIEEVWDKRGGSAELDAPRQLTRAWEVRTDDPTLSVDEVISQVVTSEGCSLESPHPSWPSAICKKLTGEPWDNPLMWIVTAEYEEPKEQQNGAGTSSAGGSGGGGGSGGSGSGGSYQYTPPKMSFRRVDYYRPFDVDGKPYLNTAGVPLENPPPGFQVAGTIMVPRKYPIDATHTPVWFMDKIGLGNLSTWGGFLDRRLMIGGVDPEPKGGYWEVMWTLELLQLRWRPTKVISSGRTVRVPVFDSSGALTDIGHLTQPRDFDGVVINEPVYLDKYGRMADPSKAIGEDPVFDSATGTMGKGGPAIIEFNQIELTDFASFLGPNLY